MIASGAPEVVRFRRDLVAVLGRPLGAGERLALAVSGGADSMAMLALAAAAYPGQVIAATVDHRLRAQSAEEGAMVAAWCARAGVGHVTLAPAAPIGKSAIQAEARRVRYDLLGRWAIREGAAAIATAHHSDDQAETFVMRAMRGSGVAGLAGIRSHRRLIVGGDEARSSELALVRPLLAWRAAELRAVAVAGGVPFADDPSNRDDKYERTRVRRMLGEQRWIDAAQIARAAAHAQDADTALSAWTAQLWVERRVAPADDSDILTLDLAGLPREVARRLARRAIEWVRRHAGIAQPAFDGASNIEALLDALGAGSSATHAGVLVTASGTLWRFGQAPPRRGH